MNFVHAQDGYLYPDESSEIEARLERLEARNEALRRELAALKAGKAEKNMSPAESLTRQEMNAEIQKEIKKNAWRSGEFRVVPYGMVWASLVAATGQSFPDDTVMWILPDESYGKDTCQLTARRSRVGIWMDGPELHVLGGVNTAAKVEIDFMGGINPTHNKPGICLREVYWKMENECFMFLAGQAKDVISPLNPHTLNYSLMWNAGNLGYFHPQFRFDRYFQVSCCTKMEVQAALVQLCGNDLPANDLTPGFPTVQARVGWVVEREWNPYPIRFGVSGHYGKQGYSLPGGECEINTWSVNLDLHVPITCRFGFQGEIFYGQGLAGVYGGIEQSIDFSSRDGSGRRNSIHSVGGWGEIWWDITGKLHMAVGYGIDDPHDADMVGCSRLSNSVIYTNLVYDFSDYLRTGIEYSYWKTKYRQGNPGGDSGTASVIEWMWQLSF